MSVARLPMRYLILLCVLGAACGREDEGVRVSLRPGNRSTPAAGHDPTLRFGIGAMISPAATLDTYGLLVGQVGRLLGRPATTVQRESYAAINDLLEQRRIDCALVCTGAYLAGRREFGMEAIAVPVIRGSPTYRSLVLVREDSGIARFQDLRGRSFAFVDPLSNTGRFYPLSRALDLGAQPAEFFHSVDTGSHDRSIGAVRTAIVAAAAVDSLIFEHLARNDPLKVKGLRVLERSPPYGAPPVVVHPDLDEAGKRSLHRALLDLGDSAEGRAVLAALGIDRFVTPRPGLYDSAAQLEARIRKHGLIGPDR